ncbi:MAG: DinB family protein [Betaproteobacteria bacterium]
MAPTTPYSKDLGDRDPLAAMHETADRIAKLVAGWPPDRFERSYAPGKWTARLILAHLAHSELALGNRARMALTTPDYAAQPFDQDKWLAREAGMSGPEALDGFLALSRMNRTLFASLSEADRRIAMTHPEYGSITVDWVIHTIAGHQRHHLAHIEAIDRG